MKVRIVHWWLRDNDRNVIQSVLNEWKPKSYCYDSRFGWIRMLPFKGFISFLIQLLRLILIIWKNILLQYNCKNVSVLTKRSWFKSYHDHFLKDIISLERKSQYYIFEKFLQTNLSVLTLFIYSLSQIMYSLTETVWYKCTHY